MERYADGDSAAFERLYAELHPVVRRRVARKVRPGQVDDLVQAAFLKLHTYRERYRTGAAVLPWVFTIVDRLVIDHYRRQGRPEDLIEEDGQWPDEGAEGAFQDPLLSEAIRVALETLPGYQKEIVILHHFHDLDLTEIAEKLGIEPGTVRVRKFRAFAALRDKLRSVSDGEGS